MGRLSQHTLPPHPPGVGGGGRQLTGAPLPANLVAHPQLVRGSTFPDMECWEPSAISLETPMEGHLGGTGVDGRQLTAGRGKQSMYLKAALHLHQKVPSSMHWRVCRAGEPTLPLRTASGPQSHALRGKDDYFLERSYPPHTPS